MAENPFSRLSSLQRTATLAKRQGMTAEPYVTVRKMGKYKYAFPQKKKMLINGVLCVVSVQRACWLTEPNRPDGIQLTQVHAHKCKPSKSRPKVLIFDIRLGNGARDQIYSITREEFFLKFPSGHANIPTAGKRVYKSRGRFPWSLHRGGKALKQCIASVKKAQRQKS
jgi:hypothetical protein